jgi:hypothetical protein
MPPSLERVHTRNCSPAATMSPPGPCRGTCRLSRLGGKAGGVKSRARQRHGGAALAELAGARSRRGRPDQEPQLLVGAAFPPWLLCTPACLAPGPSTHPRGSGLYGPDRTPFRSGPSFQRELVQPASRPRSFLPPRHRPEEVAPASGPASWVTSYPQRIRGAFVTCSRSRAQRGQCGRERKQPRRRSRGDREPHIWLVERRPPGRGFHRGPAPARFAPTRPGASTSIGQSWGPTREGPAFPGFALESGPAAGHAQWPRESGKVSTSTGR